MRENGSTSVLTWNHLLGQNGAFGEGKAALSACDHSFTHYESQ